MVCPHSFGYPCYYTFLIKKLICNYLSELSANFRAKLNLRQWSQIKCLTVVDEFTRECLAIDVSTSIRSRRVIDLLSQLVSVHGAPRDLRSDTGPEFVIRALLKWAVDEGLSRF